VAELGERSHFIIEAFFRIGFKAMLLRLSIVGRLIALKTAVEKNHYHQTAVAGTFQRALPPRRLKR
jgi:hypothetical protein